MRCYISNIEYTEDLERLIIKAYNGDDIAETLLNDVFNGKQFDIKTEYLLRKQTNLFEE